MTTAVDSQSCCFCRKLITLTRRSARPADRSSRHAILEPGCLQIRNGREIAGVDGIIEVLHVVLMVRAIAIAADHRDRAWMRMGGIGGRRVVLERLVMRNVIRLLTLVIAEVVDRLQPVVPLEFSVARLKPLRRSPS